MVGGWVGEFDLCECVRGALSIVVLPILCYVRLMEISTTIVRCSLVFVMFGLTGAYLNTPRL